MRFEFKPVRVQQGLCSHDCLGENRDHNGRHLDSITDKVLAIQ